jgi:hypothetical protein
MRSSNAAVRATRLSLFLVFSCGCTYSLANVPISPEVVRETTLRVSDGSKASAVMRDEEGTEHTVNENSVIWLEGGRPASVTFGTLYERCYGRLRDAPCPFGDGSIEFRIVVDRAAPDWAKIGGGALLVGLAGGLVTLNAGCFASWCDKTGRAAVLTLDGAIVVMAAIGVWWFTTVAPALGH